MITVVNILKIDNYCVKVTINWSKGVQKNRQVRRYCNNEKATKKQRPKKGTTNSTEVWKNKASKT